MVSGSNRGTKWALFFVGLNLALPSLPVLSLSASDMRGKQLSSAICSQHHTALLKYMAVQPGIKLSETLNQNLVVVCVRYFGHNDRKVTYIENWYQRRKIWWLVLI